MIASGVYVTRSHPHSGIVGSKLEQGLDSEFGGSNALLGRLVDVRRNFIRRRDLDFASDWPRGDYGGDHC